jgi:hypothetical protein
MRKRSRPITVNFCCCKVQKLYAAPVNTITVVSTNNEKLIRSKVKIETGSSKNPSAD